MNQSGKKLSYPTGKPRKELVQREVTVCPACGSDEIKKATLHKHVEPRTKRVSYYYWLVCAICGRKYQKRCKSFS